MALQDLATVEMVRNVMNGTTPVAQATNAINAATAGKVSHKLTITAGDSTVEFDGSEDKSITISGKQLYKHSIYLKGDESGGLANYFHGEIMFTVDLPVSGRYLQISALFQALVDYVSENNISRIMASGNYQPDGGVIYNGIVNSVTFELDVNKMPAIVIYSSAEGNFYASIATNYNFITEWNDEVIP